MTSQPLITIFVLVAAAAQSEAQFVLNLTNQVAEVIESPNYPSDYGPNQVVTWTIDAGTNWAVVTFFDISLESSVNCTKDSITSQSFTMTWSRYTCEPLLNKTASFINPNNMILTFRSDAAVQSKGFRGIVIAAPTNNWIFPTRPTKACTAVTPLLLAHANSTQFLALPGWPVSYNPNMICTYSISAPSNKYVIRLRRLFFALGAGDKVDIYDAKDKTGRFCPDTSWQGALTSVVDFISSNDHVFLEFRSDSSEQLKGYYLSFESVLKGTYVSTPSGCDNTNYILIIGASVGAFILLVIIISLSVWCKKTGRCKSLGNLDEEALPMPKKRQIHPRRLRRMLHPKTKDEPDAGPVQKAKPPRVVTHTPRPRSTLRPTSSNPGLVHDASFQQGQTEGMSFPGTIDYV